MVVLDTCAWLWMCSESTKLSRAAREAITREQRHDGLVVSIISAWEIAKLVQKAKLSFSIPCSEWIEGAVRADGVTMHPLTPEICVEIVSPSNREGELEERKRLYFEKGASEFWLCGLHGEMTFFDPGGQIDRSQLCPDFPKQIQID